MSAQQRLFQRASLFNGRMQLTGELWLDGRWFRETIEGRPEIVLPLAGRIIADHRHEAIQVQFFGQRESRVFPEWTTHGLDVGPMAEEGEGGSNVRFLMRREPAQFSRAGRMGNPVVTGLS